MRPFSFLLVVALAGGPPARDTPDKEVQLQHEGIVHALAFSPDGKQLAVVGDEVILWDLAGRNPSVRLLGHGAPLRQVAFAPGGKVLAASDEKGVLYTWELATAKLLSKTASGNLVGFTRQGTVLLSNRHALYLWDLQKKTPRRTWKYFHGIDSQPHLSPSGKLLAVDVLVRDADTLENAIDFPIQATRASVQSVAVSGDDRLLALGTTGDLCLWDLRRGKLLGVLAQTEEEEV
jgi:hypothetical protein